MIIQIINKNDLFNFCILYNILYNQLTIKYECARRTNNH